VAIGFDLAINREFFWLEAIFLGVVLADSQPGQAAFASS
jgi:hypothetical protein